MSATRLLIVEDDPGAGEALSTAFRTDGYDVVLATDGLEARKKFSEERHTGKEGWRCGEVAAKLALRPRHLSSTMGELYGVRNHGPAEYRDWGAA